MNSDELGLWGLALSGFLSATLLPGSSEAMLVLAMREHWAGPLALWAIASLSNTAGGLTNWLLGAWLARRFPQALPEQENRQRALLRVRRWGSPALLLSWLPVVGDPLCLAAGWLGVGFFPSLLFILIGKSLRYAVVLGLVSVISTHF